jgi:hypothetical protein
VNLQAHVINPELLCYAPEEGRYLMLEYIGDIIVVGVIREVIVDILIVYIIVFVNSVMFRGDA